jgi:hypothetical protein
MPEDALGGTGFKLYASIEPPRLFDASVLAMDGLFKNTAAAGLSRIADMVNASVSAQLSASLQPTISIAQSGLVAGLASSTAALASASMLSMPKLQIPSLGAASLGLNVDILPKGFAGSILNIPAFTQWQESISSRLFTGIDFDSLLTKWYPRNWPDNVDFEILRSIASNDGIPVIWVTPEATIAKLAATGNTNERLAILLDDHQEIKESCRAVLEEIDSDDLRDYKVLAEQALDSLIAGKFGPAQAMAVVILDSLTAQLDVNLNSEPAVRKKYDFRSDDLIVGEVVYSYTMAPFIPFSRQWNRRSPLPKPTSLSRHVAVHQVDLEHYNPTNALVAVMLVTSVLRTCCDPLQDPHATSSAD